MNKVLCLLALLAICVFGEPAEVNKTQLSQKIFLKILSQKALEKHDFSRGDYLPVYANKIGPYANVMEIYSFYTTSRTSPSRGLAFCPLPEDTAQRKAPTTLAERLEGDRPVLSPVFQIKFLEPVKDHVLCQRDLKQEDIDQYIRAISEDYYYELFCDGLPVRNFLGFQRVTADTNKPGVSFLFTGFDFNIAYNNNHIISANMTVRYEDAVLLALQDANKDVLPVTFTYSVNWHSVTTPYEDRLQIYGRDAMTTDDLQIHWISIGNSFVMVLLLIGFVGFLVGRTVFKDISRYSQAARVFGTVADALERGDGAGIVVSDESQTLADRDAKDSDEEAESSDDDNNNNDSSSAEAPQRGSRSAGRSGKGSKFHLFGMGGDDDGASRKRKSARSAAGGDEEDGDFGWKLIYADVFRFPKNKYLFSLLLGMGMQVLVCIIGLFVLSLFGVFEPEQQGRLYVSCLVLYAFSSFAAGFESNRVYKQMGGTRWAWIVIGHLFFFPTIFAAVFLFMDFVALAHESIMALHFTTMMQVAVIYYVVSFPMTFIGSAFGRRFAGTFDAPCRSNATPREIPASPWYRSLLCHMTIGGFIPFSAIYVELFYIYSSIWGHMYYSIYAILLIVFVLLLAVTVFITIALIYFTLNAENYNWWWRSFICAGSASFFIIFYSTFFWRWSGMHGFLQGVFYYGWISILSFLVFVLLGTVGFYGTKKFVKFLYSSVKID